MNISSSSSSETEETPQQIENQMDPNPALNFFFQYSSNNPNYEYVPFFFDKPRVPPFVGQWKLIEDSSGATILQSCNGLLLCSSSGSRNSRRRYYYVCNPTTNKYSTLGRISRDTDSGVSLAFDPSKSRHYKVVCVGKLGSEYQIEVYLSETDSWRECGELFTAEVNFQNGVYWNGAINWINNDITGESIYFNLEDDQTPQVMPTPPILDGDYSTRNCYFGESCSHLHYIDAYKKVTEFNVYEMRTDYFEWFVRFRVDVSTIGSNLISICTLIRGSKDEEDSFLVLYLRGKLVRYDIFYGICGTIYEFGFMNYGTKYEIEGDKAANFPMQYIESLSCV